MAGLIRRLIRRLDRHLLLAHPREDRHPLFHPRPRVEDRLPIKVSLQVRHLQEAVNAYHHLSGRVAAPIKALLFPLRHLPRAK